MRLPIPVLHREHTSDSCSPSEPAPLRSSPHCHFPGAVPSPPPAIFPGRKAVSVVFWYLNSRTDLYCVMTVMTGSCIPWSQETVCFWRMPQEPKLVPGTGPWAHNWPAERRARCVARDRAGAPGSPASTVGIAATQESGGSWGYKEQAPDRAHRAPPAGSKQFANPLTSVKVL